jgi:hypothetical protein
LTATNHGLFGALIAVSMQKYPAVAVALSPLSHFLLDAIPHYSDLNVGLHSRKFFKTLFFDMTLAVASTLAIAWIWRDIALLVVVCAFLAASPDLMWLYYEYLKPTPREKRGKLAHFHGWIQWSQTMHGKYVEFLWFIILFPCLVFIGMQ